MERRSSKRKKKKVKREINLPISCLQFYIITIITCRNISFVLKSDQQGYITKKYLLWYFLVHTSFDVFNVNGYSRKADPPKGIRKRVFADKKKKKKSEGI